MCVPEEAEHFFVEHIVPMQSDIYAYLLKETKDISLTEDLLQNAMEKAWKNVSQLRDKDKARSWLFSIAKNEMNMHFRKHEVVEVYDEDIDFGYTGSVATDRWHGDILQNLIKEFDTQVMKTAISELEPKYKELVVMRFDKGMSQKDIAEALNVNYNSIRVDLARSRQKVCAIRRRLENEKR